jgi:hypothetical protein
LRKANLLPPQCLINHPWQEIKEKPRTYNSNPEITTPPEKCLTPSSLEDVFNPAASPFIHLYSVPFFMQLNQ